MKYVISFIIGVVLTAIFYTFFNAPKVDFSEYDAKVSKLVADTTQLAHNFDSVSKYNQSRVDTFIVKETTIKVKYQKVYLSLDTLSLDSTHKLFLKIYE